jgi:hypothetical protein
LRDDIAANGIRDALLVWGRPGRLEVHVGEQRLLIAEELGVDMLRCLIAPVRGGNVSSLGEQVRNLDRLDEYFGDPDCPAAKAIRDYVRSGIIKL